ncbi:glycoside hydrolase, partial [Galbitalea sp. SE-J8]|uniref:glycoside hydrolase n=1 Tax=Galbitalea sp. SE-J8 TaxID=3054952 RepID=UPI00259D0582
MTSLVGVALAGLSSSVPAQAAGSTAPDLTITPDPSYQQPAFDGWGTSLAWFANVTGGYSDEVKNKLADMVFGPDGLNLNIARYNIGGGNATDVADYLRPGGAVPGWWAPTIKDDLNNDVPATFANKSSYAAAWDGSDDDFNWNADPNQRWWIQAAKARQGSNMHWEAFSNSPPWFMTTSGYVSGATTSTTDQMVSGQRGNFTTYLAKVAKKLEQTEGITFDSVEPVNEPWAGFWTTTLTGGVPKGRQEGANIPATTQADLFTRLQTKLSDNGLSAIVAGNDETVPSNLVTAWNSWTPTTRAALGRLNTHTYGSGGSVAVRDIAKSANKPLWMSEVEGSGLDGQNFTSMATGTWLGNKIIDDVRSLEPSAWVFWQPVEDYTNMSPAGENLNWGEIQLKFDCAPTDTLAQCPIYTNTKYWTAQNFTHYIVQGDHFIPVDNANTTAAVKAGGDGVSIVHVNTGGAHTVRVDLAKFGTIASNATLTPVSTSASGYLVPGAPIPVSSATKYVDVPVEGQSVTTFVVNHVSGVADGARILNAGHSYQLKGTGSGLALSTAGSASTLQSLNLLDGKQQWKAEVVDPADYSTSAAYRLKNVTSGQYLAAGTGNTLTTLGDASNANTRWMVSTRGDGAFTLINVGQRTLVDVSGSATAVGSPVAAYIPTGGSNQSWSAIDTTVASYDVPTLYTIVGTVPTLPSTITVHYAGGTSTARPVTWTAPDPSLWASAGTGSISGTVPDLDGTTHAITLPVVVSTVVSTIPGVLKTYVGATPILPSTTQAELASGDVADIPVTWDDAPTPSQLASVGTFDLHGHVEGGVAATLHVQVTNPSDRNVSLDPGVAVAASYTESGYPASRTINGDLTEKGWSDWTSPTRSGDWLRQKLATTTDVSRVRIYFWKDGSALSYASSLQVQYVDDAGDWVDASEPVLVDSIASPTPTGIVVEVPVSVRAQTIRVTMNARTSTHIIVSEMQVYGKTAGVSTDASARAITLDAAPLESFDPATTEYSEILPLASTLPTVAATASDPLASVSVTQATSEDAEATVTVTAESGATRAYTIAFSRGPAAVDPVAVHGAAVVGGTLTSSPANWDLPDVDVAYQWLRDGSPIAGATSPSLEVTAADLGTALSVRATASRAGYADGTSTSTPVTVSAGSFAVAVVPVVSGAAVVGGTLSVSDGEYSVAGVSVSRQWLAGGVPVAGATGASFAVTPDLVGVPVSVRVTASRAGYADVVSVTDPVTVSAGSFAVSVVPVVSGAAVVGGTVSVTDGEYSVAGVSVSRQWLAGGVPV